MDLVCYGSSLVHCTMSCRIWTAYGPLHFYASHDEISLVSLFTPSNVLADHLLSMIAPSLLDLSLFTIRR